MISLNSLSRILQLFQKKIMGAVVIRVKRFALCREILVQVQSAPIAMSEIGLFIVKPDGVLLEELEDSRKRIQRNHLEIFLSREVRFTSQILRKFYHDKLDDLAKYWEGYLIPLPSVAIVVQGKESNFKLGKIKRDMRRDYGHDGFYNGTHCSDSEKEAIREMKLLGLM
jgi:nucleoside diphosphate kinase